MPGLLSKEIGTFLSRLAEGGKDIFASRDLRQVFFPTRTSLQSGEEKLEPERHRARQSPVKDEVDEEDEYEDVKDAFAEIPDDRKEGDLVANEFEDTYDDDDHIFRPAYSDEEGFSENDGSSNDSDNEKPKNMKKKRNYKLSNL